MTLEYLAGIFDGEGCIDVQRQYPQWDNPRMRRFYVRPRVRMCMADSARNMMTLLHTRFGGHLVQRQSGKRNQQGSWSLEWLNNEAIRDILNVMLPHLILKREQALLALWWLDHGSGRQTKMAFFSGMEQARKAFAEELSAMKRDPQRLSERAVQRITALMRQSEPTGDRRTAPEMGAALA